MIYLNFTCLGSSGPQISAHREHNGRSLEEGKLDGYGYNATSINYTGMHLLNNKAELLSKSTSVLDKVNVAVRKE